MRAGQRIRQRLQPVGPVHAAQEFGGELRHLLPFHARTVLGQQVAAHRALHELLQVLVQGLHADLRARLAQNPDQVDDWVMLARVERALDHFDAAQQALGRALKLSYNHDWAIERAEMIASQQQGRFQGEPWQIIESVLRADPEHLGALLLAGSASYAESRYKEALAYWQKASDLVPPQSPDRQPLDAALVEVRAKLGLPDPRDQALAASAISGRVSLGPAAQKAVQADDTVFIYATLPDARMPLAILRIRASELPYDFTLDDRQAMNPQARLSMAERVVVRARVSRRAWMEASRSASSALLAKSKFIVVAAR